MAEKEESTEQLVSTINLKPIGQFINCLIYIYDEQEFSM